MTILIKGMEMPENCEQCPFFWDDCGVSGEDLAEDFRTHRQRHPNCPLVLVPPHGDLIDKDMLIGVFKKIIADCKEWNKKNIPADQYVRSKIKRAEEDFVEAILHIKGQPTIIEAEE